MSVIRTRPAAVSAAVVAVINLLVVFGVVSLTDQQIGMVNIAVAAVLGLFVQQTVTPIQKVAAYSSAGQIIAGPATQVADGRPVAVTEAAAIGAARG
jgi:hypothetical protein